MGRRLVLPLVLASLLAGCSLMPPFKRPAADMPVTWSEVPVAGTTITERWWALYRDPLLDRMVEEAFAQNRDLALAAARVSEARALLRITDADRMPSIDATLGADRTRSSARSSMPLGPSVPLQRETYRATVNVSYELDLWGRLRGASDAARAQLFASEAARETVRIALASEVVQSYYALAALDEQIEITRRTFELRGRNLDLQKHRHAAGLITDFDLRQLEAELAAARAQLPQLQQKRASTEVALAYCSGAARARS